MVCIKSIKNRLKVIRRHEKRLSICCALAGDPDVLVMDEPGAALDLMAKNEILRLIKNFTRKGKVL